MRLSIFAALSFVYASISLAMQIDKGLIRHVDYVSSISSLVYRHIGYVDQKVRQNAYTFLNHESWHQRNVVATSSNTSLGPSNITSDEIAIDEAFILPVSPPSDNSTNSSSSGDAPLSNLPELLQSTTALVKDSGADTSWDDQTDAACAKVLNSLNGLASNPSGLAACYNIRSYDNITGMFQADLRLFQISVPAENWTHLKPSSETLDIVYATAEIIKSNGLEKRGQLVAIRFSQMPDSKPLDRRSSLAQPKMLQGMTFLGMIRGDVVIDTLNE